MSPVHATLLPSSDGSLHLPLPPELLGAGKLKVVAWLEPEAEMPAKPGAADWALQARGIVKLSPGESPDDARMASLQPKFGGP
jgi:hypothetical protein